MAAWVVLPFANQPEATQQVLDDIAAQTLPEVRPLLIANGTDPLGHATGVVVRQWHYQPPLPLAAVWNQALRFVWATGGETALVVNNDIRLHPQTYQTLLLIQQRTGGWFVSGVGVTPPQFAATQQRTYGSYDFFDYHSDEPAAGRLLHRGGPDFSCFLITKDCHRLYPFDEGFHPAYCEDLDYHRRLLLDGHGDKIFSVNLPFQHEGSGTLRGMSVEARARVEQRIGEGSRAHYRKKWGGDVNQETYTRPFDPDSATTGVTTPELQRDQR